MAIIAVFNCPGGVGRAITALNLLAAIARQGQRPWGIDLDPEAHLSQALGTSVRDATESMWAFFAGREPLDHIGEITRSGVILCPAHAELGQVATTLGKGLSALTLLRRALRAPGVVTAPVVIDCPPGFNTLSLNALFASDLALVPITEDSDGIRAALDVERALNALEPLYQKRAPRRYVWIAGPGEPAIDEMLNNGDLRADELCATRVREHGRKGPGSVNDYDALIEELAAILPGFRGSP